MRILVLGDFHGKFPNKIKSIVIKEKVDLVVSIGDHFPFSFRKIWFKHSYEKGEPLWKFIGKKKYKQLLLKDIKGGDSLLGKLNDLPVPVFVIVGNVDYSKSYDCFDYKPRGWKWDEQDFFSGIIKKYKNIKRFDYSYLKFKDFVFIGGGGHSFPGFVKSKSYKKHKKILDDLFNRFRKENGEQKLVFVMHNVPYKTKLDFVKDNNAHKLVRNKHVGSKMNRRIIDKYQPILAFGGHVHESYGMQRIGKTLCVNIGSITEGKEVILEIDEKKPKKFRVRFIK